MVRWQFYSFVQNVKTLNAGYTCWPLEPRHHLHPQCSSNQVKVAPVLTNLFIEMDGPVAEGDAVTEAVLARRTPKLPVEPDVLAFGVGVEARWVHIDADRKGRGSSLDTCPIIRQAIILPVDHRAWLQSCIYEQKSNRKSSVFTFGWPSCVQTPFGFSSPCFGNEEISDKTADCVLVEMTPRGHSANTHLNGSCKAFLAGHTEEAFLSQLCCPSTTTSV